MSNQYVLVDQNNIILYGPDNLPDVWINADGTVTDLSSMAADDLTALGWMIWVEVGSDINPIGQYLSDPVLSFSGGIITATYTPEYFYADTIINNLTNIINNYRDNLLNEGLIWSDGNLYQCDDSARANINGAVTAANTTLETFPQTYYWRTYDNKNVAFSSEQIIIFGLSVLQYYSGILAASWIHKDSIAALTDPAEILAYDYTQNWPSQTIAVVTFPLTTAPPVPTTVPPTTTEGS